MVKRPLYVPYHRLDTTPNIVVDGAANHHTQLTLSHWPGAKTPPELKDDLSAGIVFNYLADEQLHLPVEAVSNNHFDEDGLVGIWSLLEPDEALERQDSLIDIAAAGDFGTYKDRDSARVSFVLRAWADAQQSPLSGWVFEQPYLDQCAVLYEELLPRLDKIVDRISSFKNYWQTQDKLLDKSEQALRKGEMTLVEHPQADLAVVTLPEPRKKDRERELRSPWNELVQEMAIHNQTGMMRVLLKQEKRYCLYFRYETWVQYVSRQLTPRIDLEPFCSMLNQQERHGAVWTFDDLEALQPKLSFTGALESDIPAADFTQQLTTFLATAAAASGSRADATPAP